MRSIRSYVTATRAARPSYQPNYGRGYSFAVKQGSAFLGKQSEPGLGRPE
jgi:hypothetical protein